MLTPEPIQFYFGMYSSKTHDRGQKLADRGNQVLSQDAVKLLKTQDAGYLKTMAQQTRRAREKLEKAFVLREGKGVEVRGRERGDSDGVKTMFVDSGLEQRNFAISTSTPKHGLANEGSDTPVLEDEENEVQSEEAVTAKPKPRRLIEAEENALRQARVLRKRRKRDEETQGFRLKALKSREKDLLAAERELELQRAKMSHSIGGVNKAGIKWKIRQRKT